MKGKSSSQYKSPWPPCLSCTPKGYKPWTESLILCPGNMDYFLADIIVPPLYSIGFTPNGVTCLNCVNRGICLYFFVALHSYSLTTILLILNQVLDCADGQMARRYEMGSSFGAWFDHTTDTVFGVLFALSVFFLISSEHGWMSWQNFIFAVIISSIGLCGRATMDAKERSLHFRKYNLIQVVGMYQELYMSLVYPVMLACFYFAGFLPQ